jgi:hypothetical protein
MFPRIDAILDCTTHGDIVLDGFLAAAAVAMGWGSIPAMSTRSFAANRA